MSRITQGSFCNNGDQDLAGNAIGLASFQSRPVVTQKRDKRRTTGETPVCWPVLIWLVRSSFSLCLFQLLNVVPVTFLVLGPPSLRYLGAFLFPEFGNQFVLFLAQLL